MRFLAAALLLAFVLIVTFDVTSAQSRVDRSASWFKPSPNVRSPQYSRSRLGGSRLLPRRMYRSLPQADYQAMWDKLVRLERARFARCIVLTDRYGGFTIGC